MLSRNPDCLEKLRKEHDEVLGVIDETPNIIKQDPHIINKLEYTLAVVREVLRLWPPVNSTRGGEPDLVLHDPKSGEAYPTEGFLVSIEIYGVHHNAKVWGDSVETFDPSRFLDADRQPEEGFRPFEKGSRNCIGQELAMLELRIVLALVARSFDFKLAYNELDMLKNDGSFWAEDESYRRGKQDLDGEEAWSTLLTTAKPREGMPVRVNRVS